MIEIEIASEYGVNLRATEDGHGKYYLYAYEWHIFRIEVSKEFYDAFVKEFAERNIAQQDWEHLRSVRK